MGLRAIDQLYSREDIMNEVNRHNDVFNLEDFYLVDPGDFTPSRTGYRIVSSDRVYSGYCIPYSEFHEDTICNILFGMYDDYNSVYAQCDYDFRNTAAALGAVMMQLLSKYYSLIWVSSDINEFQYNAIVEFAHEMDEINRKLVEMGENDIKIGVCLVRENGTKENGLSLDETIELLSEKFSVKKSRRR